MKYNSLLYYADSPKKLEANWCLGAQLVIKLPGFTQLVMIYERIIVLKTTPEQTIITLALLRIYHRFFFNVCIKWWVYYILPLLLVGAGVYCPLVLSVRTERRSMSLSISCKMVQWKNYY